MGFHLKNPLEGYRRLTFMMLDADIVTVSPSSAWRVLNQAGLLLKWNGKPSKKGTGSAPPLAARHHWHTDFVPEHRRDVLLPVQHPGRLQPVHRELGRPGINEPKRTSRLSCRGAKEKYPDARPRIISDNGRQLIAKDFKEFIRISGMTHVRTSPFYPQSKGKIERWHKSLKGSASGQERCCRLTMHGVWCRVMLTTTTTSA